jgi:hypothetical protein
MIPNLNVWIDTNTLVFMFVHQDLLILLRKNFTKKHYKPTLNSQKTYCHWIQQSRQVKRPIVTESNNQDKSKDLLSLNPTIKTSMHVFYHTIKPILLYGCEVWGMFNPFTSKFRNTLLNFSRIFDKLLAEKLHQKFCKYILGVHSKKNKQYSCAVRIG